MKVHELIAALQQLPQDLTVVVRDADTGWAMDEVSVRLGRTEDSKEKLVVLDGGGYSSADRGYLK